MPSAGPSSSSENVRYEVREDGVLIQIRRTESGNEHLKFIHGVPGLQTPNLHLYRQEIPIEPQTNDAQPHDDHGDLPVEDEDNGSVGTAMPNDIPDNEQSTPRRARPLQANPRMAQDVQHPNHPSIEDIQWSQLIPIGRERMQQNEKSIRREVAAERATANIFIFWRQKTKLERERDEIRRLATFCETGIGARSTSGISTGGERHLSPPESVHSSDFSSVTYSIADTEISSAIIEDHIRMEAGDIGSDAGNTQIMAAAVRMEAARDTGHVSLRPRVAVALRTRARQGVRFEGDTEMQTETADAHVLEVHTEGRDRAPQASPSRTPTRSRMTRRDCVPPEPTGMMTRSRARAMR